RVVWACGSWPRAWKPRRSCVIWRRSAATNTRASCTAGRCRWRSSNGCAANGSPAPLDRVRASVDADARALADLRPARELLLEVGVELRRTEQAHDRSQLTEGLHHLGLL